MAVTDWADLMPATVSVYAKTGYDNYGVISYSTAATTYRARVVRKNGNMRQPDGSVISYGHQVWVASTAAISPDAKITLPDGTSPSILSAEAFSDENGSYHHTKLLLGF